MDATDRRILEIEQRRYVYGGAKVRAIREETGLSPTRFYARLNELLDVPAVALEFPQLVNRLRRIREQRLLAS